jgi:hypothetical protein
MAGEGQRHASGAVGCGAGKQQPCCFWCRVPFQGWSSELATLWQQRLQQHHTNSATLTPLLHFPLPATAEPYRPGWRGYFCAAAAAGCQGWGPACCARCERWRRCSSRPGCAACQSTCLRGHCGMQPGWAARCWREWHTLKLAGSLQRRIMTSLAPRQCSSAACERSRATAVPQRSAQALPLCASRRSLQGVCLTGRTDTDLASIK